MDNQSLLLPTNEIALGQACESSLCARAQMSEDTLAEVLKRLEAAEAEASRLKQDLAAAQKVRHGNSKRPS